MLLRNSTSSSGTPLGPSLAAGHSAPLQGPQARVRLHSQEETCQLSTQSRVRRRLHCPFTAGVVEGTNKAVLHPPPSAQECRTPQCHRLPTLHSFFRRSSTRCCPRFRSSVSTSCEVWASHTPIDQGVLSFSPSRAQVHHDLSPASTQALWRMWQSTSWSFALSSPIRHCRARLAFSSNTSHAFRSGCPSAFGLLWCRHGVGWRIDKSSRNFTLMRHCDTRRYFASAGGSERSRTHKGCTAHSMLRLHAQTFRWFRRPPISSCLLPPTACPRLRRTVSLMSAQAGCNIPAYHATTSTTARLMHTCSVPWCRTSSQARRPHDTSLSL